MFPPETKILVIDDSQTMRRIVCRGLMEIGFKHITEAKHGRNGWDTLIEALKANTPFELVVSDWNMPEMTGIDLLRAVRNSERLKSLPFVLLTAESEKAQVVEAIQAGVDGYITKPFTAASLKDKLSKLHAAWMQKKKAAA